MSSFYRCVMCLYALPSVKSVDDVVATSVDPDEPFGDLSQVHSAFSRSPSMSSTVAVNGVASSGCNVESVTVPGSSTFPMLTVTSCV